MIEFVFGAALLLLIVVVFGWLGFFTRIWTAFVAFVFVFTMLSLALGANGYVFMCLAMAGASFFGANQWARHRIHTANSKEAQK